MLSEFLENPMAGYYIGFIIVVLIYFLFTSGTTAHEDYLHGFWLADDDEFCEIVGINSMLLFVGETDSSWTHWMSHQRECHLVIMDNECNQGLTLNYTAGWKISGCGDYTITANVCFEEEQIWPDYVTISINMADGIMRIIGTDDVCYAKLYKQHNLV
jgi:hypothetical protein